MAAINLQDAFAPTLTARGFVRSNKVLRRPPGESPGMTVWLNPENRLKHVRTVMVDCWWGDEADGWLYSLDQARAVGEIERGGSWASFDYSPQTPGWPEVIVEDFERVTVPFIDACTSPAALCDLVLDGRIPPANMKQAPIGWIQDAWSIADKTGLPEHRERALAALAAMELTRADHDAVVWWAGQVGIGDLVLRDALPERRRWFDGFRRR
jgi:hypothetical protein